MYLDITWTSIYDAGVVSSMAPFGPVVALSRGASLQIVTMISLSVISLSAISLSVVTTCNDEFFGQRGSCYASPWRIQVRTTLARLAKRAQRDPTTPAPPAIRLTSACRPFTLNSTQITTTFPKSGWATPTPCYIEHPPSLNLVPCQFFLYIIHMDMLVPDIEESIPLPAGMADALPDLSPADELQMRANTIKFFSDMTGQPIVPNEEDAESAVGLAREMVENPKVRPDFAKYPNETIALYAGLAARYNHMIVQELSDLKLYVVNKLFEAVEQADDVKTRVSAIKALGEVDGIDAFKKRSEVTHVIKPLEEVEKELLSVLEGIEYSVVDEKPALNAESH